MKKLLIHVVMAAALGGMSAPAATQTNTLRAPLEQLTLEQALELAEGLHPELAEGRAMIEAAAGRARQAGAFPNPEAIIGAQQLPLGGSGAGHQEYVAGAGQTISLGRRLAKAREAELLDQETRARGLEVKRRDMRRRVHSAFATALYQARASQARSELHQQAAKALAITRARLQAGDAVPEEAARVEVELARSKVELHRADALREQSLLALAAAIGDSRLAVKSLDGALEAAFEVPALETLAANLSAQPENRLADAEVRARQARVDTALAERIPDVKVEVLYHRLQADRANTLDLGLSIPLPLFNRNEGRLREARAEAAAAGARARATRSDLDARLRQSHLRLATALAASRIQKTEILPKIETVRQTAEARYAAGDISLSEVLPVRRDWAAAQLSHLESLREVMEAWGEVKSLQ